MPEKVCLSCISEINHCYSFMLKCESSNHTLRQLLPDALPEEPDDIIRIESIKPITYSKNTQTLETLKYSTGVQTELLINTATTTIQAKEKFDKPETSLLIYKDEPQSVTNNNEIILELNVPEASTQYVLEEVQHHEARDKAMENEPTYYEITREYGNVDDEDDKYQSSEIFVHDDGSKETLEYKDVKFTIYNNEEGEAEILINRALDAKTRKDEHQCSECDATFVSEKNLKKHVAKRHSINVQAQDDDILDSQTDVAATTSNTKKVDENKANTRRVTRSSDVNSLAKKVKLPTDVEVTKEQPIITESSPKSFNFFCDRCNAGFARQKSLHFHRNLNACHLKTFECDECKRVFLTQENLDEHKATHVLSDVCNLCNKLCESREELSQHMVEEHKFKMRNQCGICKKVFSMVSALKDHMRVHSGEKPYLCTICGKSFSQNANLQQHIRRHAQDKKFKCDDCDQSYVTKSELLSHKRSHTGDAPFKCDFCNSKFTTSSSLLKHKRRHTGERPYACDFCPMRFAALNVLKNHRRTHTGEKPFKCHYCGKTFTQRGDCLIHLRTHTGERNHVCFCGLKFTHRSTLRTHLKTHIDNKNGENAEESSATETLDDNELDMELDDMELKLDEVVK